MTRAQAKKARDLYEKQQAYVTAGKMTAEQATATTVAPSADAVPLAAAGAGPHNMDYPPKR